MEYNYKFVTIKELADRLRSKPYNKPIGFTGDDEDDVFIQGEPTGWYGAVISNAFDASLAA